MTNLLTSQHL